MLRLQGVHVYYGKSYILQGVDLEVAKGQVLGVVGRNGVGKTTTLRTIMGLVRPRRGTIELEGQDIVNIRSHTIPRLGIGYVPQGRRIFPRLTTLENIQSSVVTGALDKRTLEEVYEYFPRLREREKQPGGTLSGGEQQMLAMARAMITSPKLMILDEPTEGLMPLMVKTIQDTIKRLNQEKGTTVLLVEQNLDSALGVAHKICVMEKGTVKYSDDIDNLDKDKLMAYLGV
ncbi:MAG: ABC transporter ATP-binding protein [Desulfarculaceae bacterium]|jgi:branched-chain amino acid transport system ATP-binding protein